MHDQNLDDFPSVARWFFAIYERPAAQRGRMLGIETQSEENQARLLGPYYGANGPAPAPGTKLRPGRIHSDLGYRNRRENPPSSRRLPSTK